MSRLCIEAHPRGHIASCNGRVELVKARAEPYTVRGDVSSVETQELQTRAEETRKRKEERLLAFQKEVKERVQRRERARQKQLFDAANRQAKEARHGISVPGARRKGRCAATERGEVAVVIVEPATAAQQARLSLLAASKPHSLPPETDTAETSDRHTRTETSPPPPPCLPSSCEERSAVRRYTASSQLALNQRQSHARQLHIFHRLYSDLERETARQRRVRQALQGNAERRRGENEVQRRMIEEDLVDCLVSEDTGCGERLEEERERMAEWEETVALERRRHQLQTARETERYLDALRAQLREKLGSCPTPLPPLCSCGHTLWDTDPQTCANNCPFYRNPRAYARALGNLLATLKL